MTRGALVQTVSATMLLHCTSSCTSGWGDGTRERGTRAEKGGRAARGAQCVWAHGEHMPRGCSDAANTHSSRCARPPPPGRCSLSASSCIANAATSRSHGDVELFCDGHFVLDLVAPKGLGCGTVSGVCSRSVGAAVTRPNSTRALVLCDLRLAVLLNPLAFALIYRHD